MRINKGFTIIELLIVIVIIGILVAITAVSYTGVTNGANTATAQSNANAVKKKATACHAKSGTWPTSATIATCDSGGIELPANVTIVAPTANTAAAAETAISTGNQKTHVALWSDGTVWYRDATKTASPFVVSM